MMLKGTDKEDVRISDIKTESYETLSAIKVENSNVCDTTSLIKIENNNWWHYIKPELHETLNTTINQHKTIDKIDPPTVNEGYTVDQFNGNLHNPVKIKAIKTRQTRSDDSLGISVRTSELAPELVIENVENGIVRNYHFTVGDRDQVRTKKGESLLPNNKEEGMLSDTNRDHLLQLDIKEEPRLSPNVKVNGESCLQEKHKRRPRLHKDYNKNHPILNCQKTTKYHKNEDDETISDKSYTCTICNKKYKWKEHLNRHQRTHTGVKPYKCLICHKGFNDNNHLQRHMNVHNGERSYFCNQCDKGFVEKSHLIRHERIHTGDKPYICSVCGNAFAQGGDLNKHVRIHTGEAPYQCTTCGQKFTRSHVLKQHARCHSGEKPYTCDTCGNSFGRKYTLTIHMKTHTGDKPHACELCDRHFTTTSLLVNHKTTHMGECYNDMTNKGRKNKAIPAPKSPRTRHKCEKGFICRICDKGLVSKRDLQVHERIHTGDKPFICEVCEKGFRSSYRLKEHMRIHTGDAPYSCDVCFRGFGSSKGMQNHKKNHRN